MQNYIFSLGIIPVQEFIAEARRSRDLRTGSAILSFLTASVLKKLNATLIIPHSDTLKQLPVAKGIEEFVINPKYSIPNRASGYLTAKNEKGLKDRFDALQKECIDKFWEGLFEQDFVNQKAKEYFSEAEFHKEAPFQLVWVARQVEEDYETRKKNGMVAGDMETIGKFFDDVKNTRPIKPWIQSEPIGKCTQCGKREAISPPDYDFQQWWKWYQKKIKNDKIKVGLVFEESERLCEVCLIKRLLSYQKDATSFPSTREIAASFWYGQLSKTDVWKMELEQKFNNYKIKLAKDLEDPFLIFYPDDIHTKMSTVREKIKDKIKERLYADIQKFNEKIQNAIKRKDLKLPKQPFNYLSVIVYDGDDMGKKVIANLDKNITNMLYEFQKNVEKLIKDNYAHAFYVGGDEGLILSPIETTLKLAIEIQKKFEEQFKNIDPKMKISMGIIFFDRKRPMGTAIQQAHDLLKKAKEMDGKNALAVGMQTASGNQWHFVAHWGADWERIENALKSISKDILSKSWAYEVEEFVRSLPGNTLDIPTIRESALAEIKRITWRKFIHKKEEKWRYWKKENAFKEFWQNGYLSGEDLMKNGLDFPEIQIWANQFHLIGFLSRYKIV